MLEVQSKQAEELGPERHSYGRSRLQNWALDCLSLARPEGKTERTMHLQLHTCGLGVNKSQHQPAQSDLDPPEA